MNSETSTATVNSETSTATVNSETSTPVTTPVTTPAETKTLAAATAELTLLNSREKESLLQVAFKSSKASTLRVLTDIANTYLVITATKKGSPTLTFKVITNNAGDAKVNTTKNLAGYTVTLSSDDVNLDSDKVSK